MSESTLYAPLEHEFAEPFAEALRSSSEFRDYVLSRTKFLGARNPMLLLEEMASLRAKTTRFWWKNYWTARCKCFGCSGSEVDVFAVFADDDGRRFALHVEVKNPKDNFDPEKRQGERYAVRAACWAQSPPPTVPAHVDACTILLCNQARAAAFADEVRHFDNVITFEELARDFPQATPSSVRPAPPLSVFSTGQRVTHPKFGDGAVSEVEGNTLEIMFDQVGRKRILESFVTAV